MTSKPRLLGRATRMPAPEAREGGLKLCRQAQAQLEDAINGVMKAEQQLRENTREVRSELQSCVSRQQEALRCREVWLLGQIELLEQVKTETLQQQLHQLHRLRGQFDVIAHQLQNNNSSNDLSNQLTSCMEKLSSLSLTPEETPEMSFHADTRSLRNAITSFGCITAQLVDGVASQSTPSQGSQVLNCPLAAKKQKLDRGSLEEWLFGSGPSSSTPTGYQCSKNPQDWLVSRKESETSCPVLASVDFLQAWGQLRDLEAWLVKDQTSTSRERTISSCSSAFSIEKIDETDFTDGSEEGEELEEDELEVVEDDAMSDWLITPPTDAMSDAERWRQVLKPFEDSWVASDWLMQSPCTPPAPPTNSSDCSSCCQTTKAMEIENLGLLKCLKTPPTSSPNSPATPTTTPAAALEAWLQQAVPVPQTCKANELCSTYADCVCDENCGKDALSRWLVQQDGCDKNGVPLAKNVPPTSIGAPPIIKTAPPTLHHIEQDQKVQNILQAWLHPSKTSCSSSSSPLPLSSSLSSWVAPGQEKASRENLGSPSSSSPFQQGHLEPDLWILSPATGSPDKPAPPEEAMEDKWLQKKRSQAQERLALPTVCDLFSCMKLGGDKELWLHKGSVQM